jgi:hypothetical protein
VAAPSRLELAMARHRVDATVELHRRASIHGYHAYLTASAMSPGSALSAPEARDVDRHTAGAGVTARPSERIDLRADLEITRGAGVFSRTDRRRHAGMKVRGRYRFSDTLSATVHGSLWNNDNEMSGGDPPDIGGELVQRKRNYGAEVAYSSLSGWLEALHGGYERSAFSSDLAFLVPQNFQPDVSVYRERGHASSVAALLRPHSRVGLDLGGHLFVSTDEADSGATTRPTRFYDARLRLDVQILSRLDWNGQWRWIEYANRSLDGERFAAHLFSTGLTYVF